MIEIGNHHLIRKVKNKNVLKKAILTKTKEENNNLVDFLFKMKKL